MKQTIDTARGPRRRSERGNLLGVATLVLVPVIGLVGGFYGRTASEMRAHEQRRDEILATERAFAAIEIGRNIVTNSTYTSARNDRLKNAVTAGVLRPDWNDDSESRFIGFDTATGDRISFDNVDDLPVSGRPYYLLQTVDLEDGVIGDADQDTDEVSVYCVALTGLWHMLEARCKVGTMSRTARIYVRERDPFTRYSIFIDNHYQGISGAPKGDIHTNRTLQLYYPDGVYDDFVSARDGFQWMIGGSFANTQFNAGYAAPTAEVVMPALADIAAIRPFASAPYYISSTYKDIEVIMTGANVQIRAKHNTTSVLSTLYNGPLPANGVIYAERNISRVEGTLNGRLTVATASTTGTTITGSVRYVDGNGNPAMLNPTSPTTYTRNPAYEGRSAFGIVSLGPVVYSMSLPTNFEFNGAIFSSAGNVGAPGLTFTSNGAYVSAYNAAFRKSTMCTLGSVIADRRYVGSVVNGSGTVLSGFDNGATIYDRELLNNPPPHFLEIDRPLFKGIEILEHNFDI